MMNKILLSLICASASWMALGEDADLSEYEPFGGALIRQGTYIGKVAIVNCQNELPMNEISRVATLMETATEIRFSTFIMNYDQPDNLLKATGAAVVIAVISDKTKPTILAAPEEHWCVVNLAKIVDDLPTERAKKKFFAPRSRKEIIKGISLVCGGGSSQYPQNIMNTSSVRELDLAREQVPVDMIAHYVTYLKKFGLKPKVIATYEDACHEGWAPAPTNDIQKAIWEKVQNKKADKADPTNRWKRDFPDKEKPKSK